jgi:hypothetical protein
MSSFFIQQFHTLNRIIQFRGSQLHFGFQLIFSLLRNFQQLPLYIGTLFFIRLIL